MVLLFVFEIMLSDCLPIFLDLGVKHIFVEVESEFSFEKFIGPFEEKIVFESLMVDRFDIIEDTYSIIQDIKVFKCPKQIDSKVSFITIMHLEWEKSAIIKRYLSDNRFTFIKLSYSSIIRSNLKVIEMCVKLRFEVRITFVTRSDRIEYLSFDIIDTKRKRIMGHRICDISKKINDSVFTIGKIVIDFDEV